MSRVLFSPVGFSDPIRDNHDGPMLHIIRHYKPDIVYLFLTKETEDKHNQDNRYIGTLNQLGFSPHIKVIKSGIKQAHQFDEIYDSLSGSLKSVVEAHPHDEIFVNITSGTPQMQSAVIVEVINSEKILIPIQTATPAKGANPSPSTSIQGFDIKLECSQLKDNDNSPKRCFEPPIKNFRKAFLIEKIKPLLKQYNYSACISLIQNNPALFSNYDYLSVILEHAKFRLILQKQKAKDLIKNLDINFDFYSKNSGIDEDIAEFYYTIVIKQKQGEISGLILKLTPILTDIYKEFLNRFIPLSKLIVKDAKGIECFSRSGIEQYDPYLLEFLDKKFTGKEKTGRFRDSFVNITCMHYILDYVPKISQYSQKYLNDINYFKIKKALGKFRDIEQKARNKTAHEMLIITDDYLQKHTNLTSSEVTNKLKELCKLIYRNNTLFDSMIYDDINDLIIKKYLG